MAGHRIAETEESDKDRVPSFTARSKGFRLLLARARSTDFGKFDPAVLPHHVRRLTGYREKCPPVRTAEHAGNRTLRVLNRFPDAAVSRHAERLRLQW
jgi:hypothetical protein